jgi:ABC-type transport system substrate-binding protein
VPAVATSVALALAVTGCGSSDNKDTATPPAKPVPGGAIVVALTAEIDGFTPASSRWTSSGLFTGKAVLDPLVAFDDQGNPKPYLAESITPSADFKEWMITLRPGVTFSDGSAVDADALVANLESVRTSLLTKQVYRAVSKVDKVDDRSVKLTMSVPWAQLPVVLASQTGFIVAPSQIADPKGSENPVGSGPFTIKEWTKGTVLSLVKNPTYWQKDADGVQLPYLDAVDIRPVSDPQNRIDGVTTGEYDLITTDNSESVITLAQGGSTDKLTVLVDDSEGTERHVLFNTQGLPFSNAELRIAAAEAINRDDLVQSQLGGFYDVANGPFKSDSTWGAATNFPAYNPDDAKARVAKVGGGQPVPVLLTTTNEPEEARLAQYVQQQWEAVGFAVELNQIDEAAGATTLVGGDFQAIMFNFWYASDPDAMSHYWLGGENDEQNILNFSRYTSPAVTDALAAGRATDNDDTRKGEYQKVWNDFGANVPFLWLYHSKFVLAYNPRVRNVGEFTLPDGSRSQPVSWGSTFLTGVWVTV